MDTGKRIKAAIVWLIMAALCALVGFTIVHHYATSRRPIERFAMVIDAGSTQTRSSLFRLVIEADEFSELATSLEEEAAQRQVPVGRLLKVQTIGSCVNGGPLASIPDQRAADELIRGCLNQFAHQIKVLDFVENVDGDSDGAAQDRMNSLDADEVSKQLALMNHRVDSITHLHLGATAGMRALELLNSTRARERLGWIGQSIRESNRLFVKDGPHINTGYVGTLRGSDEASLGWVSINFVCDALIANAPSSLPAPEAVRLNSANNQEVIYQYGSDAPQTPETTHKGPAHFKLPHTIGTLELGGASAQLAFQVPDAISKLQIQNISLEEERLDLFNGHYKLATRSDLCLGMSEAVLRLNYVLLHKTLAPDAANYSTPSIRVSNACLQRGAAIRLTGDEIRQLWQGACLLPSERKPDLIESDNAFRALVTSRDSVVLSGTGEVDECDALLSEIVQPQSCKRHFALCPENRIPSPPPRHMPFVTISGYNHALKVLNLTPAGRYPKSMFEETSAWNVLNQAIEDQLGGHSIDYEQFLGKTRQYCATNVDELTRHFPKVTKRFQNIICLQLVYIRKLLVEFYQLHPLKNWKQIKFLIFEPRRGPNQFTSLQTSGSATKKVEVQPDIGWTLGLLLNATSRQLESETRNDLYHHHGASPMYIVRTTILLVVGCSLIAIAFLVISAVHLRGEGDGTGTNPQRSRRSSSYNIGTLGYTITYPANYNSISSFGSIQEVVQAKQPAA